MESFIILLDVSNHLQAFKICQNLLRSSVKITFCKVQVCKEKTDIMEHQLKSTLPFISNEFEHHPPTATGSSESSKEISRFGLDIISLVENAMHLSAKIWSLLSSM